MRPVPPIVVFCFLGILVPACGETRVEADAPASPHDAYWESLSQLCGQAFGGALTEDRGGSGLDGRPVMHVRVCEDDQIQIPFHVGENRSRTWLLTRTDAGIRLKHDHREQDGSESEVTQYGGETTSRGSALRQDFPADAYTAEAFPWAGSNIWTMEIVPGERFTYLLRRHADDRVFRVDFDLTSPVEPPPTPWGY
jgi:hypothetical protein